MELQHFRWRYLPRGVKFVRIDIDPTEMVRLKPDVGLVTDATLGTRALVAALEPLVGRRASREAELAQIKARADAVIRRVQPQMGYLDAIRRVLPRDGFFVEDFSQVGFTARFGFPVYAPRQYVTGGYEDNLGFGFNTALGVKVANPRKAVVSITGDGGFLLAVRSWPPLSSTRSIWSPSSSTTAVTATCAAISWSNPTGGSSVRI